MKIKNDKVKQDLNKLNFESALMFDHLLKFLKHLGVTLFVIFRLFGYGLLALGRLRKGKEKKKESKDFGF